MAPVEIRVLQALVLQALVANIDQPRGLVADSANISNSEDRYLADDLSHCIAYIDAQDIPLSCGQFLDIRRM